MDSYEKKYKEMKARVLEIGQGYVKGVDFSKPRQIAEYIDPELKESEDANIRGAIIDYLKDNNLTEWAAWLEKQGEKEKFIEKELGYIRGYREEALRRLQELEKQGEQKPNYCHHEVDLSNCSEEYSKAYYDGWNNCNQQHEQLKAEQKPAWSEEDEAMYQGVIETEQYMLDVVYGRKIFAVGNEDLKEECTKELAWLKSLKDRIK